MTMPFARLATALVLGTLGLCVMLMTPLQLLLALHLEDMTNGAPETAFGIVTGSGALCGMILNPVAGRVSDRSHARLGRRRTWILTGALTLAVMLVAISTTTQVWQVVLLWCLAQAGGNIQLAAANALIADQVPEDRRGRVSGLIGVSGALGPFAGIALAMLVTGAARFWLIALIGAALSALAVTLVREQPGTTPRPPLDLHALATTFVFDPRRHPAFAWAWLVRFLIMSAYGGLSYNVFFLMDRFDVTRDEISGLVLALGLISVACLAVSSLAAGYLSDRLRRQKPFVIAAGITAATALTVMTTAPNLPTVVAATALLGLGVGMFLAVDLALCVRVLPDSQDTGRDLAIINIANTLPQSLVPFIAPLLLAVGGYPFFFTTLAVIGLGGALAVVRIPEIGRETVPSRWTASLDRRRPADPNTPEDDHVHR